MMQVAVAGDQQRISLPCHFALVHHGEAEMREKVLEFLSPALGDPKQGVYLCGPRGQARRLLDFLQLGAGRDLHADVTDRRIILGEGDPDADQQLQNLLDPIRELCARGFAPVRVMGPAAWDVPGYSSPEDFLWYESRILPGIDGLPAVIMCTYDAARLPAPAIEYGALETHTHTLIDGVLSESASFIPADRYLTTRLIHLPWLEPYEEPREVNPASEERLRRLRHNRKR